MSSRALFVVLTPLVGAGAIVTLGGGCSEDAATTPPSDAAADQTRSDGNRPPPAAGDAADKTCRQECAEAHPTAVAKDDVVNACWETHCRAPCVEGKPGDGGVTDGAAPDGGTCTLPVITVSLSCDECTNTFCCAAWDTCFQDSECTELNACYQRCTN